ncbi:hypothetical protein QO002_006356 [Pararhizobium capsulatum DSM 1112]|uniref:Transmembrane protein n=1 Tax=Pararhizobium capsulatum DSM 1112 TaxID=1121113 RepID=A0ABU0C0V0_9HYPH|nr:hypothetical protein [Pararhizobium capsulatum]MDQ0324149.1 hypothetical protein [Pararhizobium capsulatum DSM 1112]
MWFAAYVFSSIIFLCLAAVTMVSGFSVLPTILAGLSFAALLAIIRYAR